MMEYCEGGSLVQRMNERETFPEDDVKTVIYSVFEAVNYLHSIGIVHRDLKMENIMFLDQGINNVKIIDFGLSCKQE